MPAQKTPRPQTRILIAVLVATWLAALPLPAQTFTIAFNTFFSPDCVKNKFGV